MLSERFGDFWGLQICRFLHKLICAKIIDNKVVLHMGATPPPPQCVVKT